jgi:hypothetical protein
MRKSREERQREFRELDLWLQRLHAEYPVLFNLLSLAVAVVLFGAAMLLNLLFGGKL